MPIDIPILKAGYLRRLCSEKLRRSCGKILEGTDVWLLGREYPEVKTL